MGVEIINYYTLFSFRCGVHKYTLYGYGTVWCEDKVQSANWARTISHTCEKRAMAGTHKCNMQTVVDYSYIYSYIAVQSHNYIRADEQTNDAIIIPYDDALVLHMYVGGVLHCLSMSTTAPPPISRGVHWADM